MKKKINLTKLLLVGYIAFLTLLLNGFNCNAAFDTVAPQIGNVKILNREVFAPSTISIELTDIVEDESGITRISLHLTNIDPRTLEIGSEKIRYEYLSTDIRPLFTGDTCILTIPVTSVVSSDLYILEYMSVLDTRGNMSVYGLNKSWNNSDIYSLNHYVDSVPTEKYCNVLGKVKVYGDQFDKDLAISNPNLASQIMTMSDGEVARIFMDNSNKTTIPKSVFDALKGTNKKIIINVSEGIQWIFDGHDISKQTKDIDCKIDISVVQGQNYGTNKRLMKINFAPNGMLPGKATIKLKSDYITNLYNINHRISLYYVNDTAITLENDGVAVLLNDSDTWCEFSISHNSTFLLSQDKLSHKSVKLNASTLPLQLGKSTTALKIKSKSSKDKIDNWKSSKPKIVSVSKKSGKLTAKKLGTTVITLSMKSGASAKCKVKVQKNAVKTKKLTVNEKSVTLKRKKSFSIKTTQTPLTTSDKLTYTSSNKKVASVTNKGKVKTLKSGKVTITVKSGKKKVKVKIIVK